MDQAGDLSTALGDLYAINGQRGVSGETAVASDPTVLQDTYAEAARQPAIAVRHER
jgi:hypothetical protein